MSVAYNEREFSLCTVSLIRESTMPYKDCNCASDVYNICKALGYENFAEEVLGIFCCNNKGKITTYFEVSRGTVSESVLHPREIFKRAILANASSIIMVHNHPSGEDVPSGFDLEATKRIAEAGKCLGISLVDHVVVGYGQYTSMAEYGYI